MEFLVEFELKVPPGTPATDIEQRERAEESAAAKLAAEGHLVRVWNRPLAGGNGKILGLYQAQSESRLNDLLGALPLYEWMNITVTPLEPHPNDPAAARASA